MQLLPASSYFLSMSLGSNYPLQHAVCYTVSKISLSLRHRQTVIQVLTALLESYCIVLSTYDGNENHHAGDVGEHTELSSVRLSTQSVTCLQRCFKERIRHFQSTFFRCGGERPSSHL
jgi:hypothetical protein